MSSMLQYPDAIDPEEMQIWNNAAFDNGESEGSMAVNRSSWWSQSLESSCSKENLRPGLEISPVSANVKTPICSLPLKPLESKSNVAANVQGNPMKIDLVAKKVVVEEERTKDERKIDLEIEEIEKEIKRLSSKLEALRLQKAEKNLKAIERRGRVVPAKFMEQQKQGCKIEDHGISSAGTKVNRRGVSLGPVEIISGTKTRFSLSKPDMLTPVSTQTSRRKSCFWKLADIDELRVTKERGKSSSVSPQSRKTVSEVQAPKQALTTVGSKRPVKKDDRFLALIQPKSLFKDGEKLAPNKKPVKPGRVVPSRYNQIPANQSNGNLGEARKRSLPDSDKEDGNKRRASRGNGASQRTEPIRAKKKWEIPSEVVVSRADTLEESPQSISVMAGELPKIRTTRCVIDTPRDSGAAKRVADLVGTKSYFTADEDAAVSAAGLSVCQTLSFAEEEDDV